MATTPLKVLVPVDGSNQSRAIIPALKSLMEKRPLRLTLFQSARKKKDAVNARRSLSAALEETERRGIQAATRSGWGTPEREIETFARAGKFDWIAMTTHGRTGLKRALMGSVAEGVLRKARRPVLFTGPGSRVGAWDRLVVAVDGSSAAEKILEDAIGLSRTLQAKLYVLRVGMSVWPGGSPAMPLSSKPALDYLHRVCSRLTGEGALPFAVFRRGVPARQIVQFAREIDAGLICLTTHGRTGWARALMGSVAEQVIRKAPCPVLVRRSVPARAAWKRAT